MRSVTSIVLLAAAVAGCAASTRIVQQWQDPGYTGGAFKRVFVIGVTRQSTARRVFEDEFCAQLAARAVECIQSYRLVPEDGVASRDRYEKAVRDARADAVFVASVLRVERRIEIVPTAPVAPVRGGFYGYYGTAWGGPLYMGYAAPPAVFQYDEVFVESRLFPVAADQPAWTATTEIFAPSDPKRDAAEFTRTMIEALAARKLI